MPNSATLIIDIGSVTTRATLTDHVAGQLRLIAQAEVPSTYEPPHSDVMVSIIQAAAAISDLTGRQLLLGENLLMPRTNDGDGIDHLITVTSAAGPMAIVVTAVSSDISARSALHASRAVNSVVLQTITLNDATEHSVATGDYSWIERQVQRMIGLNPDVVILAGGLEQGAQDSLVRLAHIIGLTALSARVDSDGQSRHDVTVRPVIYAGNSRASEQVVESLANKAEPIVVENLRPSLDKANLAPTRKALTKLYTERILRRMPGLQNLRRVSTVPIRTTTDAAGLITRFLADFYGRNILAIDLGSASTSALLSSQGAFSAAVLGAIGSGYGVGHLVAERGTSAFMRWLPFPISDQDMLHSLLNKQLRPQLVPTSREDVMIEHAVAREAVALTAAALFDERPGAPFDFVLASGGVLSHAPHPGYALLTLLDALQPLADERAIDIYLDTLGLVNTAGALAPSDAEGALSLIEQDLLRNMPLATCVVALGAGRSGELAVEATLRTVGGSEQTVTVNHGQIARLDLPQGQKGQLILKPAGGVRIGGNAAGASIETGPADISGSALGVVIDARGRPLRLPIAPLDRQRALWEWLVALGAESGTMPYEAAEPLREIMEISTFPAAPEHEEQPTAQPVDAKIATPPPAAAAPEESGKKKKRGKKGKEEEEPITAVAVIPTAPPPSEPTQQEGGGGLDRLRQSVEQPKKRGLFGRK